MSYKVFTRNIEKIRKKIENKMKDKLTAFWTNRKTNDDIHEHET